MIRRLAALGTGIPMAALLILLGVAMATPSAVAQIEVDAPPSSRPRPTLSPRQGAPRVNRRPQRPGMQTPQKPADPAKIRGTFTLNGEEVQLTEGEFYATYLMMKPHEETPKRPLLGQKVLEHILHTKEALSLGFGLSDEEKDLLNPMKSDNADMREAMAARLPRMGISEEQYVQYQADRRAIERMKNWYASSQRVLSEDVYALWKRDNFLYRISYKAYKASDFLDEARAEKPTDAQLKEFWTTSPKIQNEKRQPTTVTADIIVFDPSTISEEEVQKLRGSRKISRKESLSYFNANKARLVKQVPSDKRHLLHPTKAVPIEKVVTPFSLLKDVIEREIIVGDRIIKAYADAEKATNREQFAQLATTYGLKHIPLNKAARRDVLSQHQRFGMSFFATLFNAGVGTTSSEIAYTDSLQYFWRLDDKAVSSLPEFATIKDDLVEPYFEFKAQKLAQAKAQELTQAIEEAVKTETGDEENRIDTEAAKAATAEIKQQGITEQRSKNAIMQKHRSFAEQKKRLLRSKVSHRHFDKVAKDLNLELEELGPFAFDFQKQIDRDKVQSKEEQRKGFLMSSYQIKSMEGGQVSPILPDMISGTYFIVRVDAKETPPFEAMSAVDYHQRKMGADRQAMFAATHMWSLFQVQSRLGWKKK